MKNLIAHITAQLQAVYPADEAEALAWWIAEELSGKSRTELQFGYKSTTNFPHLQIGEPFLAQIISRLLHFEPIQYIFGHTVWNGLDLKVTPATLIPRPETAELVDRINEKMGKWENEKMRKLLDIGTGSGCIAIALKKRHPEWDVTGIDISPEAIEVAKENALRNNAEVNFRVADVFSDEFGVIEPFSDGEIEEIFQYDIVVSNPPYICEKEKKDMRPNVLNHEPHTALFVPDDDPLKFYRRIAALFSRHPSPVTHNPSPVTHNPSLLFFEINEAYASEIAAMLDGMGYTDIQITKDIYGKDRIIEGRMAK